MFENKKILILGFARSGYEASKFLIKRNNEVILNDGRELKDEDKDKYDELISLSKDMDKEMTFVFGNHPDDLLDESFDYLIKNPGVPIDHKYVIKARELNIPVINEVEMAYLSIPKDKNIKVIGITGTNGKTTTTTLIYEFIKEQGLSVHLAGNIGYPLCSFIDKLEENDIIVMETSCQQLENLDKYCPDVAVLTNISEAHIDFMKTYDHYKYVKSKIFKEHTSDNVAVLNMENEEVMKIGKEIKSQIRYFSSKNEINGCYINDGAIYYFEEKVVDISDIRLRGVHNLENIMAAVTAVKEFGVSNDAICSVLKRFTGVEHRLEFVREVNGVSYYNDTEATNIKCCQIALSSFSEPTVVILGGMERGQDFNELKDYMRNVKSIIAIGTCRDRVQEFGESLSIPTYSFEFLKDGFKKIPEIAEKGDVVVLSPASASWDQYKECEVRGAEFKKYVNELEEI